MTAFYDLRAIGISVPPSVEDLCHVSGKDVRVWGRQDFLDDVIESIRRQLELSPSHAMLEVGCAAGLLTAGLSRHVGSYSGIDVSRAAVGLARSRRLAGAEFQVMDAARLDFPARHFDRVLCYDVLTNVPAFRIVRQIMSEMMRVTRPGGKMLIGGINDRSMTESFGRRLAAVAEDLDRRYGPARRPQVKSSLFRRILLWYKRAVWGIEPKVGCYFFCREEFLRFGEEHGLTTQICDVHERNPYFGCRFNVLYTIPGHS
ncbi:MAG: hypothetical protein A3G34_14190 [Candidatus Lindowbacteria bacterium RIFCSPLOWO2_12_FULL_62_27]|nr:MAG: hypothetical protein A3I06_15825 [Candidatus Lindowbacteria bacterium RIFCSPLOWO2_02_FULL_62_12]OGH62715.1 MAG: hypothetical protein A3G34_14190 [Candidatus Lindowbacteria bacterium RIFCSPLOWO2_12_FULL_62_27]